MGKGKKKKSSGQGQQAGPSQGSQVEEEEVPGVEESSDTHAMSKKDKRAAKKAAAKQSRQTGETSSQAAQAAAPEATATASTSAKGLPSQAEAVVEPSAIQSTLQPTVQMGGQEIRERDHKGSRGRASAVVGGPDILTQQVPAQEQPPDQSRSMPPSMPAGRRYGRGRGHEQSTEQVTASGGEGDRTKALSPQEWVGRGRGRAVVSQVSPSESLPHVGRGGPRRPPGFQTGPPPIAQTAPGQHQMQPPPAQQMQPPPAQQMQPPPAQQMQPPPAQQMKPPPVWQVRPPPAQQVQAQVKEGGRGSVPQQQLSSVSSSPPIATELGPSVTASQQQMKPQHKPLPQPVQARKDVERVTEGVKRVSLDTLNIPVRPDINKGGTKGRPTVVDTNHLQLDLRRLKNKICIHYDVDINPDRPKRLFRAAVEAFRIKHFGRRWPAFDGRKNLISSTYLPNLGENEEVTDTVAVKDDERDRLMEFQVTIKCVDTVDLRCLDRYMVEGSNLELPQKAIQMLDIVIRNAPAQRFIQVGRSFFTQPEQVQPLGNGMHMWLGFYQSVILGWKPFLNVDVAHKGFPAAVDVTEAMREVLSSRTQRFDETREISRYQKEDLSGYLKGLKVEYKLPNQPGTKRTYRVNSVNGSASKTTFKMDSGRSITVEDYFEKEKNIRLKFPWLPVLHVGSINRANPILLPVELCTILPGQVTFRKMDEIQTANMIKYAATPAPVRRGKIHTAIRQANYNRDPGIQEFGITVSDQFESVNARILDAPKLSYKQREVVPSRGVWRPDSFLNGQKLNNWWIINFGAFLRSEELWSFGVEMRKVGVSLGMTISEPKDIMVVDRRRDPPNKLFNLMCDCKSNRAELVLVIIDDNRGDYAEVKKCAELKVGILTQCLKKRTVSRGDRATISNVLLKINSKLNGVNHKLSIPIRPPCLRRPVMIIGADVTHPSPDQRSIPSVAAVCASHDPDAFQYNLQYRLQPPRQEIIEDLKAIMCSQLKFFFNKTRCKPERLIFYRDGVSEGQFGMVLNEELREIKAACRTMNPEYEPKITFLVVQKRHHTRFFPKKPEDEDGRNKNVPAGTIVDTTITHPRHIDFYLVSHASIQGVSRPTKYRTLWDDSDMSVDELEQLTYYLCHLFSRCTRSVSYPAPTYYAHLAAYRARTYIEGNVINLEKLPEEQAARVIKDEIAMQFPMFFV